MTRSAFARSAQIAATLAVCFVAAASIGAQPDQSQQPPRERLLGVAREIMQAARYCAVITVDEAGWPQARTIDAFAPDETMVVWFATNPKSRKVAQIQKDPRVTLYYFDVRSQGYVTLLGRARLVNDKAEKSTRWKEGWEAFWPDRDASYLLVEVTPERLEVVSPTHGIGTDPVTWKPFTVEFGAPGRTANVSPPNGKRESAERR